MTLRSLPVLLRYALSLWLAGAATLALALPEPRLPREGLTVAILRRMLPVIRMMAVLVSLLAPRPGLAVDEPAPRLPREGGCVGNLYAGTLDDHHAIGLSLVREGEQLTGSLSYEKDERYDAAANRYKSLHLQGQVHNDGQFVLFESDRTTDNNDVDNGVFRGAFDADGKATGTWETATGDRKLPFRFEPTDSLEQGRNPRYRLRFEPENGSKSTAQDVEALNPSVPVSVWLSIEGGKEMALTDKDNNPVSPCFPGGQFREYWGRLDPTSVEVRRLNGQPALHWMTYDLKSQGSRGYEVDRRHRVVDSSKSEPSLFDDWARENSYSGNLSTTSDRSEHYAITYKDSTLRIMNKVSYDEDSEYVPLNCWDGEYKEDEEEYEIDWRKPYYSKRIREIDVQTRRVMSDRRFQAREYISLSNYNRCSAGSRRPLHFQVLYDDIAGWLLAQTPEQAEIRYDPEQASEIPAISSCWLYNRAPWEQANATRAYPPAAPDQMRPGVAPPAGCCVVETEASGRLTRVFARQDPEDDGDASDPETKGRLLAVFDAQSGHCLTADLIADGPLGHALTPAVAPQEHIALASAIRRRVAPDPEAEEIISYSVEAGQEVAQRLALGTPVLALGRSALASRIDGVEDHWYWVAAPDGNAGWVFGALLAPLDPAYPERAWRQVIERAIAALARGQTDPKELAAFLGRLAADLPGPAVDAAAMDPRELLARVERHQRDCREPQGGPLPQARRVPPETRLTVGAGVRVRPAPRLGCGLLERLPIGTPVKVQRRTAEKTRVGAETDYWYEIETRAGVSGWVFGALLTPFDPAHPGRAWRTLIERQRRSPPDSLRAAVDWLDWQGRVRPKLPPDLLPDLELARLDGIRAIDEAPGLGLAPLGSPWAAPHLVGLDAFIAGDGLDLGAAYRAWHDRHPGHPAAEHAAWQPTINPTWLDFGLIPSWDYGDEGDGEDLSYHLGLLADNPFVRYLRLHPRGAHADEARREVEDVIKSLSFAMDSYGDALATPEFVCRDQALPLRSASATLGSIAGEQAAALRSRIAALLRIECPPTAVEPTAGDKVPAAPAAIAPAQDRPPADLESLYPVRAQVSEGLAMAGHAKVAVAEHYMSLGRFPIDNAEAGLPAPDLLIGNYVSGIRVEDGAIHVAFGNRADKAIRDRLLSLRPAFPTAAPSAGHISWWCGYAPAIERMSANGRNLTSIPESYLPVECRGH